MTAQAAPISYPSAPQLEFWDRFQRTAEAVVRECNIVASDCLWSTATSLDSKPSWTVFLAMRPSDSMQCSFDPETGILVCTPGVDIGDGAIRFQYLGGSVDALRCGTLDLTLEQVIAMILDRLEWPDAPCGCNSAETRDVWQ